MLNNVINFVIVITFIDEFLFESLCSSRFQDSPKTKLSLLRRGDIPIE